MDLLLVLIASWYYAIRVEFQLSHRHSFLWIPNSPTLNENLINKYIDFLNSALCGNLPSKKEDPNLYHSVKTFQLYSHSKTCHKYKNMKCRFKCEHFFTEKKCCEAIAKRVKSS